MVFSQPIIRVYISAHVTVFETRAFSAHTGYSRLCCSEPRIEYKRRQADIWRNNLTLEEMKVAMEKIETKEMVDKETQFSGPETDTDSR